LPCCEKFSEPFSKLSPPLKLFRTNLCNRKHCSHPRWHYCINRRWSNWCTLCIYHRVLWYMVMRNCSKEHIIVINCMSTLTWVSYMTWM
jgi:hypothetical protein